MNIEYKGGIDLSQNDLAKAVLENLSAPPSSPRNGQLYYDSALEGVYCYIIDHWARLNDSYIHPSFDIIDLEFTVNEVIDTIETNDEGHVISVTKRDLTLNDLGYTGDPDANNYIHDTFTDNGMEGRLVGLEVIKNITVNEEGHVESVDTGSIDTKFISEYIIDDESVVEDKTWSSLMMNKSFDKYLDWGLSVNEDLPVNIESKDIVIFKGSRGIDVERTGTSIEIKGPIIESSMKLASFTSFGIKRVESSRPLVTSGYIDNFIDGTFVTYQAQQFEVKESGYYDISFNGLGVDDLASKGMGEAYIEINAVKNFASFYRYDALNAGYSIHSGVVKLFQQDIVTFNLRAINGYEHRIRNPKVTFKKIRGHDDRDSGDHNGSGTVETIECSEGFNERGNQGEFDLIINAGTDTGITGILYDMYGIPDEAKIIWGGEVVAETGGLVSNRGSLLFNKTSAFPETFKVVVTAPRSGTAWMVTGVCPGSDYDETWGL